MFVNVSCVLNRTDVIPRSLSHDHKPNSYDRKLERRATVGFGLDKSSKKSRLLRWCQVITEDYDVSLASVVFALSLLNLFTIPLRISSLWILVGVSPTGWRSVPCCITLYPTRSHTVASMIQTRSVSFGAVSTCIVHGETSLTEVTSLEIVLAGLEVALIHANNVR